MTKHVVTSDGENEEVESCPLFSRRVSLVDLLWVKISEKSDEPWAHTKYEDPTVHGDVHGSNLVFCVFLC